MTSIFFTDNSGAGFSDNLEIDSNLTVEMFLSSRGVDLKNFGVRVNRQPANMNYVIQDGDRVTLQPLKIAGA